MPAELPTELDLLRRQNAELKEQLDAKLNGYNIGHKQTQMAPGVKIEDVLANITEAFIVLDYDWRIVYVNPEAERINGKQAIEFLGKTHWDEWPASVGTEVEKEYRHAMEARVPVHFEHLYGGGYNIWLEIHAFPCEAGLTIHYRDISERKRIERDLCKRERELTDFLENATVGLHWVGPDGTILWANDAELKLLGYHRDEYLGRNIRDFHRDESVIEDILARLNRKEELHNYQARLRCKDESIRYVLISSNVYWDDDRFIHTRCFTRDITEIKLAEEARFRLGSIVESSDDAIISKDLEGIIRSWNRGAERIFGYTAAEAVGRHISMLAAPEKLDEMPKILQRLRAGERVDHFETRRRAKDGRILTVSLTVSPIRDSSGTIIGASKVARDITERERVQETIRQTNQALRRANEDLEQFSFAAAHDLQEPIRMVRIYSQMLQRKYSGTLDQDANEYIRQCVQGGARLEALVRDLLTYTQVTSVSDEPSEPVDLNMVLAQTEAGLQLLIDDTGAEVVHGTLPEVFVHEVHLQQVFQNLISNAIKYHGKDRPRIIISAEARQGEWLFSVSDNGIGIEEEYKEKIFGLFKRLHTSKEYSGTGIGLAICQKLVERYGGRIWVESAIGKGSTFFFTLPHP